MSSICDFQPQLFQLQLFCVAVFALNRKLKIMITGTGRKDHTKPTFFPGAVQRTEIEIGEEHLKLHKISNSSPACCVYNMLRVITSN